jgi:hypothetical protein
MIEVAARVPLLNAKLIILQTCNSFAIVKFESWIKLWADFLLLSGDLNKLDG